MKCDEARQCMHAYNDFELDDKARMEVGQHLAACPDCTRAFSEEQKFNALIKSRLKNGQRTATLWESIESSVAGHARETSRAPSRSGAETSQHERGAAWLAALVRTCYASLLPSPRAWAALASVWVVILTLNLLSRGGEPSTATVTQPPSVSQVQFALKQRQLLTAELGAASSLPDKARSAPPSPRSDLRDPTRNA